MQDRKVTPYYVKGQRRVIESDSDECSDEESENKIVDIKVPQNSPEDEENEE